MKSAANDSPPQCLLLSVSFLFLKKNSLSRDAAYSWKIRDILPVSLEHFRVNNYLKLVSINFVLPKPVLLALMWGQRRGGKTSV